MSFLARAIDLVFGVCMAGVALAQQLPSVSVKEAAERLASGKSVLVDIRTPEEWTETGVPKGAVKLDMTTPDFVVKLDQLRKANPGKEVDIICRAATRTALVQARLHAQGWKDIINVRGGVSGHPSDVGWLDAGLPVDE